MTGDHKNLGVSEFRKHVYLTRQLLTLYLCIEPHHPCTINKADLRHQFENSDSVTHSRQAVGASFEDQIQVVNQVGQALINIRIRKSMDQLGDNKYNDYVLLMQRLNQGKEMAS